MALSLAIVAKDAANDAITALVDGGTTNTEGMMLIKDGGSVLLCEILFQDPAFAASAAGQAALLGTPLTGTAVDAGAAALFDVVDKDEVVIYSGTVGLSGSGADAIIDSTTIQIGDTIQLNSHTITAP